ncbi:MAG: DEAD/DEAH box helicase [Candidatus Aenigmarchaeota archaeon]|nr:DEAD/DEAH box helicase [Candidatus Aenigmarchaeota archaeon]
MEKEGALIEKLLKISNFKELNPVQKEAVSKGLLENRNMVIATPTASGKTFLSEIVAVQTILEKRKKVVYMAPLVALAAEKYQSFKKKYRELGIKTALSVGDLDGSDPHLRDYDIIVCSNEKLDSLLRHDADWIRDVGLVIADEIHMLNDMSRGPTLEIALTKLRNLINPKVMALSATIKNVDEIAKWLDANYLVSEWRPVKLYEGVCYDNKINFFDKESHKLPNKRNELGMAENTLKLEKQALFFVATRKAAESLADMLKEDVKKFLKKEEMKKLNEISKRILNALERPTKQCKKLADCVKFGVAFHHAGIVAKQRHLIEENFRNGLIKFIIATPTLAMGVSLPAFRVIIRDVKRYYPRIGSSYIPVLEYKQMAGRAGRPEFDRYGESILVAKNEMEAEELVERYISGEPEEIYSKLAVEPVLRTHALSLISSGMCNDESSLEDFFAKTFYASQYGNVRELEDKIENVIEKLIEWGFISKKGTELKPTRIGKRVSELYIDPHTARHIIGCLENGKNIKTKPISYLHMVSNTIEMKPLLNIGQSEFDEINIKLIENEKHMLCERPSEWDIEFDDFLKAFKTSLLFSAWIDESGEDEILEKFKVTPGELRSKLEIADWLLYASQELAIILKEKNAAGDLRKLRARMKYGIGEELLSLARLKGIGRVRARKLYNSGIKNVADIKKVSIKSLSLLVGEKTAKSIKELLDKS